MAIENSVDLSNGWQSSPTEEECEFADELIVGIESNPGAAEEIFLDLTEANLDTRPGVFYAIWEKSPEYAYQILENLAESDYQDFSDGVLSLYPVKIGLELFKKILTDSRIDLDISDINIIKLLFVNVHYVSIFDKMPDETIDMLSEYFTESMLSNKQISLGLKTIYNQVGLGAFLRLTRKITDAPVLSFIKENIIDSCPIPKLKNLLNEYIVECIHQRRYFPFPLLDLLSEESDEELLEVFDKILQLLYSAEISDTYRLFADKIGLSAEVLPSMFELVFQLNRTVAYKILKSIKGSHRQFSKRIFSKLPVNSRLYLLERTLIENTHGDRRTKIELAKIMSFAHERNIVNQLNDDCVYKLFIHFVRDYYEINNALDRADILLGFERIVNSLNPDKLNTMLSKVKAGIFITFLKNIPICKDALDLLTEEIKTSHHTRMYQNSAPAEITSTSEEDKLLSWLKKQNLKNPITTVDIIDLLETVLEEYLGEMRTYTDITSVKKGMKSMDMILKQIIDDHYIPFKNSASLEQSAQWFIFYTKLQHFRQEVESMPFGDAEIRSVSISNFLTIAEYLNNFFSKILKEKLIIRENCVEIDPIFLPEGFERITGRVKVIELKDFRNEEDTAIYYRQFKYLKPSNLAIVYGFPVDYSSTGKAGAIITGALSDRDQYETAHSYKRAMEIGAPLTFFPNARIAFQHLNDKWATIFKSKKKIYLRMATKEEIDERILETKKPTAVMSISGFIPDAWPEMDIVSCSDSKNNLSHLTGRKSEILGRLINLIPTETETDSFTWSFAPYAKKLKFATVHEKPQREYIKNILESYDLTDHFERNKAAKQVHDSFDFNQVDITTTYFKALWRRIVETFGYSDIITQAFMMRLTMNLEDRPEISAAGVYLSLPVLPGYGRVRIAQMIKELYKSAYSPKAIEIRELMNVSQLDTYAAILFERMPDWRNPVLSGNLIVNTNSISGGFSIGHGNYLMDKGNKPSIAFSYLMKDKNYPVSIQAEQEFKYIPQNDYKAPYIREELTEDEKNILAYPRKTIDQTTIDRIIKNCILVKNTFGPEASWDMELTIEFSEGVQKVRTHQTRPIMK